MTPRPTARLMALTLAVAAATCLPHVVHAQTADKATIGAAATALPLGAPAAPAPVQGGGQPLRVLRYAFPIAESGFDPAQISDA